MRAEAKGTVIATHGALVRVQVGERSLVIPARRRLRWEGGEPRAARLVVGDRVTVETAGDQGVVVAVDQRDTALLRRAPGGGRPHVIAANVDQALLVFAARLPEPNPRLLDRFLVACHHADIEAVITINKIDQGTDLVDRWLGAYRVTHYPVLLVSARTGRGLGEVTRRLKDRTTLFCGPSGAGKSSLLNRVHPGYCLKVGSISDSTGKGRHTTSRAELMALPGGGFVVDTPGLREFGLWSLTAAELGAAFPELAQLSGACRFSNCSHVHEPDCEVRRAVAAGEIDGGRYASYRSLAEEASGS